MAKAMLIMDMPKYCNDCDFVLDSLGYCARHHEHIPNYNFYSEKNEKPTWCPLREVPQKIGIDEALKMPRDGCIADVIRSYNACIDEILGGGE